MPLGDAFGLHYGVLCSVVIDEHIGQPTNIPTDNTLAQQLGAVVIGKRAE